MSWLTAPISPQVRDEKELWAVCPKCHAHFPRERHPNGLAECPACGAPGRLGCRDRLAAIADGGIYAELGSDIGVTDHLGFADASGTYAAKAAATSAKTGLDESVVAARLSLKGREIVACAMDFRFFGGSLGSGSLQLFDKRHARIFRIVDCLHDSVETYRIDHAV
ncbi:MAG: hypothetical protein IJP66_01580 [Kiritimatiellae bacterium]|nr:hypothetical protein [Kiritimatiellia bacterium]